MKKTYFDTYLILKAYYQNLYTKSKEKLEIDKIKEMELIDALNKLDLVYERKIEYLKSKGLNEKMAKKILKKANEKLELEKALNEIKNENIK
jgi:hypothetical protein